MDRDGVKVNKHAKKERGHYPAILIKYAWSKKDLLYGIKTTEHNLGQSDHKFSAVTNTPRYLH